MYGEGRAAQHREPKQIRMKKWTILSMYRVVLIAEYAFVHLPFRGKRLCIL
jgi:hypothetical protein